MDRIDWMTFNFCVLEDGWGSCFDWTTNEWVGESVMHNLLEGPYGFVPLLTAAPWLFHISIFDQSEWMDGLMDWRSDFDSVKVILWIYDVVFHVSCCGRWSDDRFLVWLLLAFCFRFCYILWCLLPFLSLSYLLYFPYEVGVELVKYSPKIRWFEKWEEFFLAICNLQLVPAAVLVMMVFWLYRTKYCTHGTHSKCYY